MAQNIDWLHSKAEVCKVSHYSSKGPKQLHCKIVSFIDVPSLNIKDQNQRGYNQLDLGSLEEREVIVIKNNDKNNPNNVEGAVCLFKQGSSEQLNVVSWISNDLQKYATGFQYGLTPASGTCKNQAYTISADRLTTSHKENSKDPSYVNKLCSLLVQKACQEIKDKLQGSKSDVHTPISGENKTATSGSDSGSEKPWFLDLHAKDIFGMALRMMQQHLLEKTREASCKINARTPNYTHKDPANYDWATGSQSPKCTPGTSGTQEPLLNEPPRTSISGILLSFVQKVLRDAASNLDDCSNDAYRAYKQAPLHKSGSGGKRPY